MSVQETGTCPYCDINLKRTGTAFGEFDSAVLFTFEGHIVFECPDVPPEARAYFDEGNSHTSQK